LRVIGIRYSEKGHAARIAFGQREAFDLGLIDLSQNNRVRVHAPNG